MTAALLTCRDARIDADGAMLLDGLSFEIDGARIGLVGAFGALFRLLSHRAVLSRGSIDVLGQEALSAVRTNTIGVAPFETVLPEPWTVLAYLTESARLMGLGRWSAAQCARAALDALDLGVLGKRKIGTLGAVERRSVIVAHAALGDPTAIFVECPLAGLAEDGAAEVRSILERAANGRRLVASVTSPAGVGAELNLLAAMDRVVVMQAGTVVALGPPAEALTPSPRCVVRALRGARALTEALTSRGFRVEAEDDGTDSGRLVVHLGGGATAMTIVDAALDVDAPLLELVPVGLDPPG